jgi:digeranylgeranylglycerophospholipid reductase
MIRAECDVLVVGLGPGGAAAAAGAAAAGLRVIAIDRKQKIGLPVQCAEFVPMPLSRHTTSAGVLMQRINGMTSVLPSGAVVETAFTGLMVDRAAFDQALVEAARRAGAVVHAGTRLQQLDTNDHSAIIRNADGAETQLGYRLLVAADGPHSTVARLLGLPPLQTVDTRQYTVPLLRAFEETDIWLSPDYPGGYAWLFPKKDRANLGLGMDRHLRPDMKTPLDVLHRQLVAEGRVGDAILARTGGAIPVGGLRKVIVKDAIAFVGDAAGLTHPVTGAGIAAAVTSGEMAAAAAVDQCAGNRKALSEYADEIHEQFGDSLARAVVRRQEMMRFWNTSSARDDAVHRRGWIAFDEYYRESLRDEVPAGMAA